MKIDAHQHFWRTSRGDYGWLTPDLDGLFRDFDPADLHPLLIRHGFGGTVLVQAAPTTAETDYLLDLADQNDFIKGVVGWVDFEAGSAAADLDALCRRNRFVGVRPMIQDIDDTDWMLGRDLHPAFEAVVSNKIVFDALVLPRHLTNTLTIAERYPDMTMVIDHGAKPEIRDRRFRAWASGMTKLAEQTNAYCKLSGLITEANSDWEVDDLRIYVDHLLSHFGPDRLIWGSDWPVCTLAGTYDRWLETTETLLADLSAKEKQDVFGLNAVKAYGLKP